MQPHAPFERTRLAGLFLLNAGAMGMWTVPMGNVLKAHGYESIVRYAYACGSVAAFISPLIFSALADQRTSSTRIVRGLAAVCAVFLSLTAFGIEHQWPGRAVLAVLLLQAICMAPIFGLSTTIILASLREPAREYGPLRVWASVGWMAGCWVVSLVLAADTSPHAGYAASAVWALTALFTYLLPDVTPGDLKTERTWRDVFGLQALGLFSNRNHRVVFITACLLSIPMAAFYPYTPMHLLDLGVEKAAAAMTLGQVSELFCMYTLGTLIHRYPLKWVFLTGIGFGIVRYGLCAVDVKGWLLFSVSLHGCLFTLFFITAQIYLEQRVPTLMRARAQALLAVMISGFGNLAGYLGNGWWLERNTFESHTRWTPFWLGLTVSLVFIFAYFAYSYQRVTPPSDAEVASPPIEV